MYSGPERRKEPQIAAVLDKLDSISNRLDSIEKKVSMVEGAWIAAKYVVAIPALAWGLYQWAKDNLR